MLVVVKGNEEEDELLTALTVRLIRAQTLLQNFYFSLSRRL